MPLQAALNNQAFQALGADFEKWVNTQDAHHKNQIKHFAMRYMCNNLLPATCPQSDIYTEGLIRACEATFRSGDGYESWSKWWSEESGYDFDGDANVGFVYTIAEYDALHYTWRFK